MQMIAGNADRRYMATSDLINELVNGRFILKVDQERRLTFIVFKQLFDESGEVSKLALKWFVLIFLHFHLIFNE